MQLDTPEDEWLTVYFDDATPVEISKTIDGNFENMVTSEGTINDLRTQENVQVFGERVGSGFQAVKIVIGRHTFTVD